tara:strand:- start:2260 stop:3180 length:921 start_codon:yes stop_codon:yes gene_type:complete
MKFDKKLYFILSPIIGFLISFIFVQKNKDIEYKTSENSQSSTDLNRILSTVAALGQLTPSGEIRSLAAPVSGFGGTPRISKLFVNEGDLITKGYLLAEFDNRPQILADISKLNSRIFTLETNIILQKKKISRYRKAANEGAASIIALEDREDHLIVLRGQLAESIAELSGLNADLVDSQLRSPIDGIVLKVNSRVGERPGIDGVLEVGANQVMEALIEVYESDINRIKIGQSVSLFSENGGFSGSLQGKVKRISPKVSQRKVLSVDPTGDADARIVRVRVSLSHESIEIVKDLTGMKVIARFEKYD